MDYRVERVAQNRGTSGTAGAAGRPGQLLCWAFASVYCLVFLGIICVSFLFARNYLRAAVRGLIDCMECVRGECCAVSPSPFFDFKDFKAAALIIDLICCMLQQQLVMKSTRIAACRGNMAALLCIPVASWGPFIS